jgi:hypothetical protein
LVPAESDNLTGPHYKYFRKSRRHRPLYFPLQNLFSHKPTLTTSASFSLQQQRFAHTTSASFSFPCHPALAVLRTFCVPHPACDVRGPNYIPTLKTIVIWLLSVFSPRFLHHPPTCPKAFFRLLGSLDSDCDVPVASLLASSSTTFFLQLWRFDCPSDKERQKTRETNNQPLLFPKPPFLSLYRTPHNPDTGHKSCLCISTTRSPSLLTHLLFGCSLFAYRENLVAPVKVPTVESVFFNDTPSRQSPFQTLLSKFCLLLAFMPPSLRNDLQFSLLFTQSPVHY